MSAAHYLLQANIYLIVFYMAYKFLLEKETYFLLNRMYLLSAALLSLLIPFLRFEWFTRQPLAEPLYVGIAQVNHLIVQTDVPEVTNMFSLGNIVVMLYVAGVAVFLGNFIWKLLSIAKLLKKDTPGSAFSFFGQKRIDTSLPQLEIIHKHEEIHIRQFHSFDVLLFELLNVFLWFNPVIYYYKLSLRNIHEYLADEAAAEFQGDKKAYALLLVSKAFSTSPNTLSNSFFSKSLLKKRIFMLHKERSTKTAILKYGMFVPLLAMALIMSSATINNNEKIKQIANEIPLDHPKDLVSNMITQGLQKEKELVPQKTEVIVTKWNAPASAPADSSWKDFYKHIARAVRYPLQAQQVGIQGTSMVKFTVANGILDNIGLVAKLGEGCDAEVMRVITAYSGFRNAKDGNYTIKMVFHLNTATTPKRNENLKPLKGYTALSDVTVVGYGGAQSNLDDGIHSFVAIDKQPGFPGGMRGFYDYLSKSIKYPALAQEMKVQGKVYLSFIVEKDGTLTNIKVDRKLGAGTDEEAIRVLTESPKWIPGEKDGKPVRVKYNIPISFALSKSAETGDSSSSTSNLRLKSTGVHSPLILLDGKKISMEDLSKIDRTLIHSVNVLKNSEQTISYGAEAKYGVLIITTKAANQKKEAKNR